MSYVYVVGGVCALAVYLFWRKQPGARKPKKLQRYVKPNVDTFAVYNGKGPFWTVKKDGVVPIRKSKSGIASEPARTVMYMFKEAVRHCGASVAMKVEVKTPSGLQWKSYTWQEYYAEAITFARALVSKGFNRHDSVNIIGFNAPEWHFAQMGAIAAGGKGVGIYTTNLPDACKYISEHSEARVVVVENEKQLEKYAGIHNDLPNLLALVVYRPESEAKVREMKVLFKVPVYLWKEFQEFGTEEEKLQVEVEERIQETDPGQCCSLIYTSGTTGNPKAVMISHDNATWTALTLIASMPEIAELDEARIVSYLPLSHIAAQLEDIFAPLIVSGHHGTKCAVYFAQPTALKGTLVQTLTAARPSLFFGVPRVWEKIQEKMTAVGKSTKGIKLKIAKWAKAIGKEAHENSQVGGSGDLPAGYRLANALVFKKIRQKLGLDQCHYFFSGAAPITRATLDYFGSLDIPILELYGMSECTGPQNVSMPLFHRVCSCGPALQGCEIKIDHDAKRDKPGEGEICFRGRHIMMGYMKNAQKTQEAIDPDGWMHSGDVGKVDSNGLLSITGRIKELIITAGGENIAPVPIEENLCNELPAVEKAMLVGDKRKYNSVLFTLKTEVDADGAPTNKLTGPALEVSGAKTVEEAMKDKAWQDYLQKGIDAYNKKSAVSRAQRVVKFTILPRGFSVDGGELTPTLKLKRPVVVRKYAQVIESLY